MAWIELHQTLPTNKKTLKLKRLLKIKTPQAVGHLCMLWLWALDNAPDGDISEFDADDIADVSGWAGKSTSAYLDALIESGFVNENMTLHDWDEYAGRLISQRAAQKEYKNRQYALYNDMRLIRAVRARDGDTCQYCGCKVDWKDRRGTGGGTYDVVDPNGDNSPDNIVVCCRSCSTRKKSRSAEEAEMPLITGKYKPERPISSGGERQKPGKNTVDIRQEKPTITVPYRTLPYPTVPNNTLVDVDEARAREEADEIVDDFVDNRNLTMKSYFGMTPEVKREITAFTESLFSRFTLRKPTDQDVFYAFSWVRKSECKNTEGGEQWTITFPQDSKDLLMYAFEHATMVGCSGNWNYINGIMAKLGQRGIKNLNDAESFDWDRESAKYGTIK